MRIIPAIALTALAVSIYLQAWPVAFFVSCFCILSATLHHFQGADLPWHRTDVSPDYPGGVMGFLWCLGIILAALIAVEMSAHAQVVPLHVIGDGFTGDGTAVCIGRTNEGFGLYLTAKHNFRDATSASITLGGQSFAVRRMREHSTADVACFESQPAAFFELAETEPVGEEVTIPGYGPTFNGRETAKFSGTIRSDGVIDGEGGLHSIPGDSGAPVLDSRRRVCGIVFGYQETAFRSDNADRRFPTRYTGLRECRELLTQRYSCGPGGCKIWIRQEYRQPVGILGLPYGPPRVVNVAEPVPRVFVPEDQVAAPQPKPDPISTQGPPGRDGKDGRSVTPAEVESIVSAWLDSNRDELAKAAVDLSGLERRVSDLEKRPFTLILAEDGKEVDREVYAPGQPVVLDVRRFKK